MAVPYRSYSEVETISLQFLDSCGTRGIVPVPIETIVEFGLGIDIVPIPGIRTDFGVHAFLSSDFESIYVDEDTMKRFPEVYRFSLAHELGHNEMHDAEYPGAPPSIADWIAFQKEWREDDDYKRCEGQAYDFAGLVLVPTDALRKHIDTLKAEVGQTAYYDLVESQENRGPALVAWGKVFHVSPPVIEKRLVRSFGWRDD
ncbi:MAG TPA: ImmA/IrrE family metallo-endopeptidase [Gemmatimonadales bacterium]|jgi:hypothetical protein|nr:ImmA/IrrE family metallo-endopeptidase [Gemmatimonadales bacterium]